MAKYVDLDLSFGKHPGTKDVLKKYDVEACKTAIRNIFLYNKYDKPFDPNFGVNISALLFETLTPALEAFIKKQVEYQLSFYDPRIILDDLKVSNSNNDLYVTVSFHVIGFPEIKSVNIIVERTR